MLIDTDKGVQKPDDGDLITPMSAGRDRQAAPLFGRRDAPARGHPRAERAWSGGRAARLLSRRPPERDGAGDRLRHQPGSEPGTEDHQPARLLDRVAEAAARAVGLALPDRRRSRFSSPTSGSVASRSNGPGRGGRAALDAWDTASIPGSAWRSIRNALGQSRPRSCVITAGDGRKVPEWAPEVSGGRRGAGPQRRQERLHRAGAPAAGLRPRQELKLCREREGSTMQASTSRILTTHVGSLPRPQNVVDQLFAQDAGEAMTPSRRSTR